MYVSISLLLFNKPQIPQCTQVLYETMVELMRSRHTGTSVFSYTKFSVRFFNNFICGINKIHMLSRSLSDREEIDDFFLNLRRQFVVI